VSAHASPLAPTVSELLEHAQTAFALAKALPPGRAQMAALRLANALTLDAVAATKEAPDA
jgi:hypothetical protein